ncbi:MAG TPA: type II secretion system protein GspM [Solirubrobacteraceae bacterium]|nr:type II secretion system protein GspM [Solirubrobacteraceae bacterium]
MTTRDRLVVMGLVAFAILAAAWFLAVSPERGQASKLGTQVSTAREQLAAAQTQVTSARGAQAAYSTAYASLVRLGKAVPPSDQIPSLVYQLDQASNQKDVDFSSITSGNADAAAAAATTAPAAAGGFAQKPFTFVFNGSYFDLYHLLNGLNRFTLRTASGGLQVTGRLLTIQSANLDSNLTTGTGGGSGSSSSLGSSDGELKGTITATAYVLPTGQDVTDGATPAGPAGTTAQPATGSGSAAPASTPAVVKVTP